MVCRERGNGNGVIIAIIEMCGRKGEELGNELIFSEFSYQITIQIITKYSVLSSGNKDYVRTKVNGDYI